MSYDLFAGFYDVFTADVDYDAIASSVDEALSALLPERALLVDLGCGTGSLLLRLMRLGWDGIGVDSSTGMLSVAREKLAQAGFSPLLLCQALPELDLYGTVRAAVCTLDTVNHLTEPGELAAFFGRVALFLEPGGVFWLDANTLYKHRSVLADNAFVLEEGDALCLWQNTPASEDAALIDVALELFVRQRGGLYRRQSIRFAERAYAEDVLREALHAAGFVKVDIRGEGGEQPAASDSQRLLIRAVKA